MTKKKNENKWLQLGNFLLGVESAASGERFVVKSVSGDWRLMWEYGTCMYAVMLSFTKDEKCHEYIKALLTLFYAATNYPHDLVAISEKQKAPFMDGFTKLINEQTKYEISVKGEAESQEEDDKALKEVVEMQDIQDELDRMDGTE